MSYLSLKVDGYRGREGTFSKSYLPSISYYVRLERREKSGDAARPRRPSLACGDTAADGPEPRPPLQSTRTAATRRRHPRPRRGRARARARARTRVVGTCVSVRDPSVPGRPLAELHCIGSGSHDGYSHHTSPPSRLTRPGLLTAAGKAITAIAPPMDTPCRHASRPDQSVVDVSPPTVLQSHLHTLLARPEHRSNQHRCSPVCLGGLTGTCGPQTGRVDSAARCTSSSSRHRAPNVPAYGYIDSTASRPTHHSLGSTGVQA